MATSSTHNFCLALSSCLSFNPWQRNLQSHKPVIVVLSCLSFNPSQLFWPWAFFISQILYTNCVVPQELCLSYTWFKLVLTQIHKFQNQIMLIPRILYIWQHSAGVGSRAWNLIFFLLTNPTPTPKKSLFHGSSISGNHSAAVGSRAWKLMSFFLLFR